MILVADIGGTNTRVAVSADGRSLSDIETFRSDSDMEVSFARMRESSERLARGEHCSRAIIGIAGTLSSDRTTLVRSPHLQTWVEECTASYAEEALGMPVVFENDAALGALGEAAHGAGRGYDIVAYVTVSTGVGGARVTRGVIDATHSGFKIGWQLLCINGEQNDLEHFVSGSTFAERYGDEPKRVRDPLVWEKVAQDLADGLFNTLLHWSPDVLVLGGSMMKDIPLNGVIERLRARERVLSGLPKICIGELGDSVGLYGALAFSHTH